MSHYASETFLHQLMGKALAAGATDIHLKVGKAPGARVGKDLVFFRVEEIQAHDTDAAALVLLGSAARIADELVFSYEASAIGRFRVSAFRQRGALSLVLRRIPLEIPTPASLGLPKEAVDLAELDAGLVVLAGGPSSGRSTTAAALVGHLNATRACHVLTLQDPIEHVHVDRLGSVTQRAIGPDVASLALGLVGAARHDADAVLAADLRTAEELDAALEVAPRSLVVAVVAARDLPRALARLASMSAAIPDGTERLAGELRGVAAQRLLPRGEDGARLEMKVLTGGRTLREALRQNPADGDLSALSFEAT